jgi:hypothetical protein
MAAPEEGGKKKKSDISKQLSVLFPNCYLSKE